MVATVALAHGADNVVLNKETLADLHYHIRVIGCGHRKRREKRFHRAGAELSCGTKRQTGVTRTTPADLH